MYVCTDVASVSKTYLAQEASPSWEFLHHASFSAVTFASYFACAEFVLAKAKRWLLRIFLLSNNFLDHKSAPPLQRDEGRKYIASTNMSSFPRFETNGEISGITFVFAEMFEEIPHFLR
jgi:hypothetical protein